MGWLRIHCFGVTPKHCWERILLFSAGPPGCISPFVSTLGPQSGVLFGATLCQPFRRPGAPNRWALLMLHGSSWVCLHFHCPQMMTQALPNAQPQERNLKSISVLR